MISTSPFRGVISSEEELRDLTGEPSELVVRKTIDHLDHHCRAFIARSPLLFLATADVSGACDVSPRGDAPGFVRVLDDHRLVIPDRPGNRRLDSMRNLLSNPRVGLLFIIPGLVETLRVNGRAWVIRGREVLKGMAVKGQVARMLGRPCKSSGDNQRGNRKKFERKLHETSILTEDFAMTFLTNVHMQPWLFSQKKFQVCQQP